MSLIISIETFKKYVKVNINSDIKTLAPAITEAERRFIIPALSQELYQKLDEHVNGSSASPDEGLDAILAKVEIPLANIAYWLHIPAGGVMMDDAGIHVLSTDSHKPASEYKTEDLKESVATAGFDALDDLFAFLEENKTNYPEWVASDSYTIFNELFLRTAKEFSKEYNIGNSRRTFLAIRHLIRDNQKTHIKKILGENLYNEILAQLKSRYTVEEGSGSGGDDPLTALNQLLLENIRPALAYLTISDATYELPLEFRGNGIIVNATEPTMDSGKIKKPAENTRLQTIATRAQQKGEDYLKRLQLWLNANAASYPLYTKPDDTGSNQYFTNKATRKTYFT